MTTLSEAFERNTAYYLDRLAGMDFPSVKDTLGLEENGDRFSLTFFNRVYSIAHDGIRDTQGNPPDYPTLVILCKYLMLCPEKPVIDPAWSAFKDFKKNAQFVNINYFTSDTERAMTSVLSGKLDAARSVCPTIGGKESTEAFSYDLILEFQAVPRISLLILFNDGDDDFPAYGTVLFQRHAEHYLDPESLAVTSSSLIRLLNEKLVHEYLNE